MEKISAEQFRAMLGKPRVPHPQDGNANAVGRSKPPKVRKEPPDLEDALRAMGAFFELDPKRVNFYIRQLQLSNRIK